MMSEEITQLLSDYHKEGNSDVLDRIYPIIYRELHKIAHRQLGNSWGVDTICTTDLVSEVYLKLINFNAEKVANRKHFFAIAATAMRQIIINYAAKKQSYKRGGDWKRITQDESNLAAEQQVDTLILVNDALNKLSEIDKELAQIVELKFFAGLSEKEIAELFDVTTRTVRRNWAKAKALLTQLLT